MTATQVIVVLVAAAVAALIKSTTGMGYPLVLIPVLALFIDIADAVVIVAPSNLWLNGSLAWNVREGRHEARTLGAFAGAGLVGAVVGALLLTALPDRALRGILVGVIVLFLANRLRGQPANLSPRVADRRAAPHHPLHAGHGETVSGQVIRTRDHLERHGVTHLTLHRHPTDQGGHRRRTDERGIARDSVDGLQRVQLPSDVAGLFTSATQCPTGGLADLMQQTAAVRRTRIIINGIQWIDPDQSRDRRCTRAAIESQPDRDIAGTLAWFPM